MSFQCALEATHWSSKSPEVTHPGGLLPRTEGRSFLFLAAVLCIAWSAIAMGLYSRVMSSSSLMKRLGGDMVRTVLSRYTLKKSLVKEEGTGGSTCVCKQTREDRNSVPQALVQSFLRYQDAVLTSHAPLMAGDVVFCSLPTATCSSFAVRRVVCRLYRK